MTGSSTTVTPGLSPFEPFLAGESLPQAFRDEFLREPGASGEVSLEGSMRRIFARPRWLLPMFALLERAGLLIAANAADVPTSVAIRFGHDQWGGPTHTLERSFQLSRPRGFRSTTIYDPRSGRTVDLVGHGQLLAVATRTAFHAPATLTQQTAGVGLRLGGHILWLPDLLWPWLFGTAHFIERADLERPDTIEIDLQIEHPLLGAISGYSGVFRVVREG